MPRVPNEHANRDDPPVVRGDCKLAAQRDDMDVVFDSDPRPFALRHGGAVPLLGDSMTEDLTLRCGYGGAVLIRGALLRETRCEAYCSGADTAQDSLEESSLFEARSPFDTIFCSSPEVLRARISTHRVLASSPSPIKFSGDSPPR